MTSEQIMQKYDTWMVDEFVRQLSLSERTTYQIFEFMRNELGWHPPVRSEGHVTFGDVPGNDVCPNCGGNVFEHVLVAGPVGEPDFYQCIEDLLIEKAEAGDEVATAAMARLQNQRRGSMSTDNDPSFIEDPGNVRWRDTLGKPEVDPAMPFERGLPYRVFFQIPGAGARVFVGRFLGWRSDSSSDWDLRPEAGTTNLHRSWIIEVWATQRPVSRPVSARKYVRSQQDGQTVYSVH